MASNILTIKIDDFEHWRTVARSLINQGVSFDEALLIENNAQQSLFKTQFDTNTAPKNPALFRVPQAFISIAKTVSYHRDPHRWNLLYRVLWRIKNQHASLLEIETDQDVYRLNRMEKQVRRDAHKMKAFVRFRKIQRDDQAFFISWHQPDHRIVRHVAPFFARRFKGMCWSILTPDETATWDGCELHYGHGVDRSEAPKFDELESLWLTYYANIFNPARVKVKMMKSEMPVRYWKNLPEAEIIDDLLADAPQRVEKMIQQHEGFEKTATDYIHQIKNQSLTLETLRELANHCQACDLHQNATQTVFGDGPANAKIVLLGEQPSHEEDLSGRPFVGPAGQVLDEALAIAGLDRKEIYVTNIVKHFKHRSTTERPLGVPDVASTSPPKFPKKRLHQKPDAREVRCCRPWFDAEWQCLANAQVLICLGSTAAQAILPPGTKISEVRRTIIESDYCEQTIVTWHPSAILRSPDAESRQQKMQQLIADLKLAAID